MLGCKLAFGTGLKMHVRDCLRFLCSWAGVVGYLG